MPVLKKLVVQDFRNISLQELSFSPNINCIWGGNGEGKTNLLDAIHYLSMTRSGTQPAEKFNFRHGCKSFAISGLYAMEDGPDTRFSVQVTEGVEKKIRRDDKPIPRISEHIGMLPVVMVSPSDIELVSESGEERRKFFNAFISQLDRQYLSNIQQYNRLLTQRNRLLKDDSPDPELLDTFDISMAAPARLVHECRARFAEEMLPVVSRYYEAISGGKEAVGIEYRSDLDGSGFEDLMARHRSRDLALRYTCSGVQRDDFIFTMEGFPIRRCGSQGQQKSFLVALKFAQYELMRSTYGFPPILLLDDVFDKLDMERVSNLIGMVAGKDFGQIFITDCNKVRLQSIVDTVTSDRVYIETSDGSFQTQNL